MPLLQCSGPFTSSAPIRCTTQWCTVDFDFINKILLTVTDKLISHEFVVSALFLLFFVLDRDHSTHTPLDFASAGGGTLMMMMRT
jgi:hypothetical protein